MIGNRGSNDLSLLLNGGFTQFGQQEFTQQRFAAAMDGGCLTQGIDIDWNHDGLADKITVDMERSYIQVLLELPDKTYEKAEQIALDVHVPPQILGRDDRADPAHKTQTNMRTSCLSMQSVN